MALKCLWRPKLFRYSDKVLAEIFPKIIESSSPFVHSLALDSLKYWKPSKLFEFNKVANLLIQRLPNLDPEFQLSIFKYGILSQEKIYVDSILPHLNKFSFAMSSKDSTKLLNSLKNIKDSEELINLIKSIDEKRKNQDFIAYLNNKNLINTEISTNSDIINLNINNRLTILYSLSQSEPEFSVLLELIEKFKISNIILPIQSKSPFITRKEIQGMLQENLKDTDNYKTLDIHKLVYSNKLGIKTLNVPWSLVYKKPESKFFTYYPDVNIIKSMSDDFAEVERNTRICLIIDQCRVLDEVSEHGCYLCTKVKVGYETYQDLAIYSSVFYKDYLTACSDNIEKIFKYSSGNNLILVPKQMIFGLAKGLAEKNKFKPNFKPVLTDENNMLANLFFDREV